ncbi:aspartate-semialdehyde dehydrogenase [Thiotrichales bacterium 19S3-7]|nr:aspartate-semialdehyde dehydrogenase [Thiotrichales bacterium 19S3-7]MCF6802518.1 aspartate-semialdehyde dehydrogenase [Thiotrichales bacterium 19S3-11]
MKKLGIIGWRGMVGSVLINRMLENNDFLNLDTTFFSTSAYGNSPPNIGIKLPLLANAFDIDTLKQMDILISTQGGSYTEQIYTSLRNSGWHGYWIDAASTLRMKNDACLILDPVNRKQIDNALDDGIKNFIGSNCTVSLMMLAIHGLLESDLVESITAMTYQAISGAGAKALKELIKQYQYLLQDINLNDDALILEKKLRHKIDHTDFPKEVLPNTLAFNLLPWIDIKMGNGQSKEEYKAYAEMNKILNSQIPIDGICTRVSSLRSHSQALSIKLKDNLTTNEIKSYVENANSWVKFIDNDPQQTLKQLTPITTSGTLDIAVGRLRKSNLNEKLIHLFTVGDQLLWGAAEPLRRMLNILLNRI